LALGVPQLAVVVEPLMNFKAEHDDNDYDEKEYEADCNYVFLLLYNSL
jgi:hypothetical protein